MTEYEAATLAAQHAATLAAYVVGGAQCLLIAWGIWIMRASNTSRAEQTETMKAQTEMMMAQTRALEESTASLGEVVELSRAQRAEQQEQSAGIRALLERST